MSRQNWSEKCENELNIQIGKEYNASMAYHMLSCYFNRDDVGINKLVQFFNKSSLEEREHANKLMHYQTMRGGIVKPINWEYKEIVELEKQNDILEAFKISLELERTINQSLLNLHKVANEEGDPQFTDYLEGEFLSEQVDAISKLSKIISVIERFNGEQHIIWTYLQEL
jgi:ferritin heavy chain